jgi:hypothetical protein
MVPKANCWASKLICIINNVVFKWTVTWIPLLALKMIIPIRRMNFPNFLLQSCNGNVANLFVMIVGLLRFFANHLAVEEVRALARGHMLTDAKRQLPIMKFVCQVGGRSG